MGSRPSARVEDILTGTLPEPGAAVVYDEGDGFWPAYSAAEALAQRGWQVTFATALTALAGRVPHESVGPLLRRLGDAGVVMHVATRVVVPDDPGELRWSCVPSSAEPISSSSPHSSSGTSRGSVTTSWAAARRASDAITAIGDCVTPRRIGHAIAEGYRLGASI